MAFTIRSVYDAVCQVLLEPEGVKLGIITPAEVINRIVEASVALSLDIGLIISLEVQPALAFIDTYTEPDALSSTSVVMYDDEYMMDTAQFSLDNEGRGDWTLDTPGAPNTWAQDMLLPKQIIVSPPPLINGPQAMDGSGSGFFGTLSSVVDGDSVAITVSGAFYGILSGEFVSETYLAENQYHFGTIASFAESDGNLMLIGPTLQDPPPDLLDQYVVGVPDSFKHYVKYGALAKIFSVDGELRDVQRQRYCAARYQEGVNLAAAARRDRLKMEPAGRG